MFLLLSPERMGWSEIRILHRLFEEGLSLFLLRLPNAPIEDYCQVLDTLLPRHRRKVLVAAHHEALTAEYDLGGVYCSASRHSDYPHLTELAHRLRLTLAIGAHSVSELAALPTAPTWALLSPVFDSRSKTGYRANPQLHDIADTLRDLPFPVLAMGGITSDRQAEVLRWGFAGIAVIGAVWHKAEAAIEVFRQFARPAVLSVAGIDPSGGAGLLADHQVTTDLQCRLIALPTALTVQSVEAVQHIASVDNDFLSRNLQLNTATQPVRIAKIGMTTSLSQLCKVCKMLQAAHSHYIIWDPIVRTTASDYCALQTDNRQQLEEALRSVQLVTPNRLEAYTLFGTCELEKLRQFAQHYRTSILLKGGHTLVEEDDTADDVLVEYPSLQLHHFRRARGSQEMHGTGCQLSTAIACELAKGRSLPQACQTAQAYVSCAIETAHQRLATPPISLQPRDIALRQDYQLQYLTNQTDPETIVTMVKEVLQGGGKWVQLRMKTATTDERVAVAHRLLPWTQKYNATLIIDDDVEAVLRSGADGVHLGQLDMSPLNARHQLGTDKIIGFTCNTPEHLLRAWRMGVDYVGVGPYRYTTTKERLAPLLGPEGLAQMIKTNNALSSPLPLVAIGGITISDFPHLRQIGVKGVALSSAIERAANIQEFVNAVLRSLKVPQ